MFGHHTGYVVVYDYDFIHQPFPLGRKHAYRCRTAPHSHSVFNNAFDDWRFVCLHHDFRATIYGQFHRFTVAQGHQGRARYPPLFLSSASQMVDATYG